MNKGKPQIILSFIFGILSKVFTYILLLVFANLYAKEELGAALFVISIFHFTLSLSSLGLPYVFVSWLIRKMDIYSVFSFLLALNLALMLLGLSISSSYPWIFPIVLIIPVFYLYHIGHSILISKYKYHLSKLFAVLVVLLCIIFAYLLKNLGRLGIIISYSLSYLIVAVIVLYITRKKTSQILLRLRLRFSALAEYSRKAVFVSLLAISFTFLYWTDSIILGILSTFENVAKYNIAGHMSNIITIIPISLSLFLLNRSAEYDQNPEHKKWSFGVLNRNLRISFAFTLLLAVIINSLLFPLISTFFPKYIGIEVFVMILSTGLVFYSIYNLIYVYLTGKLKPEKAFLPIITAAILNIVLDIILIPIAGLYGIVIATLIAHFIAFAWLVKKMDLTKYYYIYLLIPFIPLSYYLRAYGLILLVIILPLLFCFRLIEKGDIVAISEALEKH